MHIVRRETSRERTTYRPIFDLVGRHLVGVEAVPTSPQQRSQPVAALVRGVLHDLSRPGPTLNAWWATVPVGAGQVLSPETGPVLLRLLGGAAVDPARLVLELDEDALDAGLRAGALRRLAALGVGLALDAGEGWRAHAAALRSLPLHHVRIDLGAQPVDQPAVAASVAASASAAAALGALVLADGVEDDEHLAFAARSRVDLVQGYRWGSTGPVEKMVERWQRGA